MGVIITYCQPYGSPRLRAITVGRGYYRGSDKGDCENGMFRLQGMNSLENIIVVFS